MQPVILYARRLQPGETAPSIPPGNEAPLYLDENGRLRVGIEAVSVSVPGGVVISNPVGLAGAVQVETVPGAPLEVQFPAPQETEITSPIAPGGGVQVETAAGVPLSVEFPGTQPVAFPSPQQVTFPSAQQVTFPSAQQVTFPSSQPVQVTSPVGAGGGVRVEANPGAALPVEFTQPQEIQFAPGLVDSFSRLRVSNPVTLFDSKFLYDSGLDRWGELTAGGASINKDAFRPEINMLVGSNSGSRAVRQSYLYAPYQPGKGRLVLITGVIADSPKANCVARIGMFDDANDKTAGTDEGGDGCFFELDGTVMHCVVRSYNSGGQVDTRVPQASWNIDRMDGTGPSGITADWSKSQIFVFDLEWLGVGTVLFALVINRVLYPVHVFNHANLIVGTYMRSASLPVRYEIFNSGATAGSTTMRQVCCSVISEGGFEPVGELFSANRGASAATVTGTETFLLAIRNKATAARSIAALLEVNTAITSNTTLLVRFRSGPGTVVTGGSWVSVDAASRTEFNINATGFSGGIVRYSGYISAQERQNIFNNFGKPIITLASIQGTQWPIIVTGQHVAGGGSTSTLTGVDWQEFN